MSQRVIGTRSVSPVRCIDIGGWLDTWFAKNGSVVNLGVLTRLYGNQGPFRGIEVLTGHEKTNGSQNVITVCAADPSYDIVVGTKDLLDGNFNHRNLLLAVLYLVEEKFRHETDLHIRIGSPIRPGASLGTSASVAVSLIKAMTDNHLTNGEIAMLAWRAETEVMSGQSGTQDQFAAAFPWAAKRIDITDFPATSCREIEINDTTRAKLNDGMITVCFGAHDSSKIHRQVIDDLEKVGPEAPELQPLRPLADLAEQAILSGDLQALGEVMKANTEGQRGLHPDLVSPKANAIITLADDRSALGWKVNGAGGDGGSITLLFASKLEAIRFYDFCVAIHPEAGYDYYEHQLI